MVFTHALILMQYGTAAVFYFAIFSCRPLLDSAVPAVFIVETRRVLNEDRFLIDWFVSSFDPTIGAPSLPYLPCLF